MLNPGAQAGHSLVRQGLRGVMLRRAPGVRLGHAASAARSPRTIGR